MSTQGKPNTIDLRGFDAGGRPVYSLSLSIAEFPKAKHLWEDAEHMRSHRIARWSAPCVMTVARWSRSTSGTTTRTGSISGARSSTPGRTLHANTGGLEPSTIPHGRFVFTVHYLHNTSQPKAPEWYAFTLVVFDQHQRVYPVELFDFPKDQQPPAIEGTGSNNVEAYREVRSKLLARVPGELPEAEPGAAADGGRDPGSS
jgi:hypothetical protein